MTSRPLTFLVFAACALAQTPSHHRPCRGSMLTSENLTPRPATAFSAGPFTQRVVRSRTSKKGADAHWPGIGPLFKLLPEPLELEPGGERQHTGR